MIADTLAVISKGDPSLALTMVHITVVRQASQVGWHAIRAEFPDYYDRRTLFSLLLVQLSPHLKHFQKDDKVFTTRLQLTNSKVNLYREED